MSAKRHHSWAAAARQRCLLAFAQDGSYSSARRGEASLTSSTKRRRTHVRPRPRWIYCCVAGVGRSTFDKVPGAPPVLQCILHEGKETLCLHTTTDYDLSFASNAKAGMPPCLGTVCTYCFRLTQPLVRAQKSPARERRRDRVLERHS